MTGRKDEQSSDEGSPPHIAIRSEYIPHIIQSNTETDSMNL